MTNKNDLLNEIKELKKELSYLRQENSWLRGQLDSKQIYPSEVASKKRGRPHKIDDTTRAYVQELRALGHSLDSIATAVGISKGQVYNICQEPKKEGQWYAVREDGSREYFSDYVTAASSHKPVRFEIS